MMQDLKSAPYPWQTTQWQYLLKRWQQGTLPHALLLSGPNGLGQLEFALAFAKQVLCAQGKINDFACGECRACLLLQVQNHPDLYLLQPEEVGKQLRIDAIREVVKQLNQTALQDNYKVIVLWPAEALNVAASNALLKNLEEPAAKTLFLIVCTELNRLAATIRSRCQLLRFSAPDKNSAERWLQPQLKPGQDSELLLTLAESAPLQALHLAESDRLQSRAQLFEHLQQISSHKAAPVAIAGKWLKQDIKVLLQCCITVIVDCVRICMGLPESTLLNKDRRKFIEKLAQSISANRLFHYLDELYRLQEGLNGPAQLNQHLFLERIFCQWYEYARFPA